MQSYEKISFLLQRILAQMDLPWHEKILIEAPKDKKFGDLALNCALILAKQAGKKPRALADDIAEKLLQASPDIAHVEVAGPGFLNIVLSPQFWHRLIPEVETHSDTFGSIALGAGEKIQVEFVSANPTGPLHIGHGRGAAMGDSIARILRFAGYNVSTEYYINDAGMQMHTLGLSVWLRIKQLTGKAHEPFPPDCYQGAYITDIAHKLLAASPDIASLPENEAVLSCYHFAFTMILNGIKEDLQNFGVCHDVWFSERSLVDSKAVDKSLAALIANGHAYHENGALWFNSKAFGDDKNRVLRKSDGSLTYFSSDIAYHANKFNRGYALLIDIWGADHHGYVARMRAGIEALGYSGEAFEVLLVQLVNLLRDGRQITMSTRAGEFETLREVIEEVGIDAARFIFLSRKSDSPLDFDLTLLKQRTMDNPVYYVQYAHARIAALLRRAAEQGITIQENEPLALMPEEEALDLLRAIDRFPGIVYDAAQHRAPHFISFFLTDIAGLLHKYYSVNQVLKNPNDLLLQTRLRLLRATAQVIKNGLTLLGVTAPVSM